MHSSKIVCQVTNQNSQVEFTWSMGGGFFRPYVVAGAQLAELREATRLVRKALEAMVYALNQAGDGPGPWEPSYELAEAGFRLHNYVLPTEDETARKVRRWLEELRKQSKLIGLEVVVEERASDPRSLLSMPWNLVYDERPTKHKAGFQTGKSVERWRPFWSIRYNLTSGRRVEPLRWLPVWDKPRVIAAINFFPSCPFSPPQAGRTAMSISLNQAGVGIGRHEIIQQRGIPGGRVLACIFARTGGRRLDSSA